MTGAAVRESLTVAGRAERARVARTFVGAVLGPGHPCEDVAALLASSSATACGIAAPVFPARPSQSQLRPGTALSEWKSLTGAGRGYRR